MEYLPIYIYHKFRINVAKYTINGSYGCGQLPRFFGILLTIGPDILYTVYGFCVGFVCGTFYRFLQPDLDYPPQIPPVYENIKNSFKWFNM